MVDDTGTNADVLGPRDQLARELAENFTTADGLRDRITREVATRCALIAETLSIKVGDGPAVHADWFWIADEIRRVYGLGNPK